MFSVSLNTIHIPQTWRCKASYCTPVASCKGYKDISSGSEDSLTDATANVGPVR